MKSSKRLSVESLEQRMMMSVAEPNNSLASAVVVDANGGFGGLQSFSDSISGADPVDYYRINAPINFDQNFAARLSGLNGDLTLTLIHDLNGDLVETPNEISVTSAHPGTADESLTRGLITPLGVYFVKVTAASPGVSSNYTLDLSNDTAGDTPAKSRPLFSDGAGSVSDSLDNLDLFDVYKVRFNGLSNTATFAARLTAATPSNYHVDLFVDTNHNSVLDPTEFLTSSSPANGGQEIGPQNLDAGKTYYVRVLRSNGSTPAENYILHTQMDYTGNTPDTARFLGGPEGRIVFSTDQVGTESTTSFRDDGDLYKFVVVNTGFSAVTQVNLDSSFNPATSRLTQEIFRDKNNNGKLDAGESLGSSSTTSASGTSTFRVDAPPGTYYMRVTGSPTPNYLMYLSLDRAPGITGANPNFSKSLDIGTLNRTDEIDDGLGGGDASDTYKFKMPRSGAVAFRLEEQFSQQVEPIEASIAFDTNGNGKRDPGETIGTFDLKHPLTQNLGAGTYYVTLSGGLHFAVGLIMTPDFAGNTPLTAKNLGTLGAFTSTSDVLTSTPDADLDFYKFKLTSAQTFTTSVLGQDRDAKVTITLYKDNGNGSVTQLKQVVGALGGNALLQSDLGAGNYFVSLSITGANMQYSVGFSTGDNDDSIPETNVNSNNQLFTDGSKDFTIASKTDVDMVRFFTVAGHKLSIDVDARNGSSLNSYLRVFDSAGNQLASNDDGAAPGEGASKFSFLKFTVPGGNSDGEFVYIAVSSASNKRYSALTGDGDAGGGSTGAYRLTITDLSGPVPSIVQSRVQLSAFNPFAQRDHAIRDSILDADALSSKSNLV